MFVSTLSNVYLLLYEIHAKETCEKNITYRIRVASETLRKPVFYLRMILNILNFFPTIEIPAESIE